jgi:hypothetical protein
LQQALLPAQHFCPDLQQSGFASLEQQADFAAQQASLAVQQSASWTPALDAVFVAQQQVFVLASETSETVGFAALLSADVLRAEVL